MPAPALSPVVTTGATPDSFGDGADKLNSNDSKLLAYSAALEARLGAIERLNAPAGVSIGGATITFPYTTLAVPGNPSSKGLGIVPNWAMDTEGKFAIIPMTATRIAVFSHDTQVNATYGTTPPFRATIMELDPTTGAPTVKVSATLGTAFASNVQCVNPVIMGGFSVSATVIRTFHQGYNNSAGNAYNQLCSATYDPNAVSLTTTTDRNDSTGSAVTITSTGMNTRDGHLVGSYGGIIPCARYAALQYTTNAFLPVGEHFSRVPGNTFRIWRAFSAQLGVQSMAVDRLTDNLFFMLSDNYSNGPDGLSACLALLNIDDNGGGAVQAIRLNATLSGNARLTALSATLAVGGFTTGSQYGTWAFARDPATNAMRVIGALSTQGNLGTAPVDISKISATSFIVWTRPGTNWTIQGTIYTIDTTVASGVSPFTQVGTVTFNLGVGMASATSTDSISVAAIRRLGNDRIAWGFRNTTRAISAVEIFDFPTS